MVFVLSSYINIEARLHLPRRGRWQMLLTLRCTGPARCIHFGSWVKHARSSDRQLSLLFLLYHRCRALRHPRPSRFWTIQPRAVNQFKAASNLSIRIHALLMPILLAFLTLTPLTFNALFTTSIHSFLGYPLSLRSLTSDLVTLSTNLPASILSMYSNRHRTCVHHTHFSHT